MKTVQADDPAHLKEAFRNLGLKEGKGAGNNPDVVAFFPEAGHPEVRQDSVAWCAAYANAMLKRSGIEGTGQLTARSFLKWGTETKSPKRGDIVVIKRGKSTWMGHVFFFLGIVGDRIWGIGGNQSDAVTVASFAITDLLGYRRVPGATIRPEAERLPTAPAVEAKPTRDQVAGIQSRLWELGYHEVGAIDGIVGPATESAILVFRKDNNLPLSVRIDGSLRDALLKAGPRPIAQSRAEASAATVRQQAPEAQGSWVSKIVAFWGMIGSAIWGVFQFVIGNIADAKAFVKPLADVIGTVPPYVWAALIGVGLLTIYLKSRKAEKTTIEAYQEGARR